VGALTSFFDSALAEALCACIHCLSAHARRRHAASGPFRARVADVGKNLLALRPCVGARIRNSAAGDRPDPDDACDYLRCTACAASRNRRRSTPTCMPPASAQSRLWCAVRSARCPHLSALSSFAARLPFSRPILRAFHPSFPQSPPLHTSTLHTALLTTTCLTSKRRRLLESTHPRAQEPKNPPGHLTTPSFQPWPSPAFPTHLRQCYSDPDCRCCHALSASSCIHIPRSRLLRVSILDACIPRSASAVSSPLVRAGKLPLSRWLPALDEGFASTRPIMPCHSTDHPPPSTSRMRVPPE